MPRTAWPKQKMIAQSTHLKFQCGWWCPTENTLWDFGVIINQLWNLQLLTSGRLMHSVQEETLIGFCWSQNSEYEVISYLQIISVTRFNFPKYGPTWSIFWYETVCHFHLGPIWTSSTSFRIGCVWLPNGL